MAKVYMFMLIPLHWIERLSFLRAAEARADPNVLNTHA